MDALLGILFVGAIIGGVLLWQKGVATATSKLNQSVFSRGKHERGTQLTTTALLIDSTRPAAEVIETVKQALDLPDDRPKIKNALYLAGVSTDRLTFHFGSALQTFFSAEFGMLSNDAAKGGSSGAYRIVSWQLSDGIVVGLESMENLKTKIEGVVRQLDPASTLSTVDDKEDLTPS